MASLTSKTSISHHNLCPYTVKVHVLPEHTAFKHPLTSMSPATAYSESLVLTVLYDKNIKCTNKRSSASSSRYEDAFLTSALDKPSRPGRFITENRTPDAHWTLSGPQSGPERCGEKKNLLPLLGNKLQFLDRLALSVVAIPTELRRFPATSNY
jgi:hypothetical protein